MGRARHDDLDPLPRSVSEYGSVLHVLNHLGRVLAKLPPPIVFALCPAYADDLHWSTYAINRPTAQSEYAFSPETEISSKVTRHRIGSTAVRSTGMTRVIRSPSSAERP